MEIHQVLPGLAFALYIGGQFAAAIVACRAKSESYGWFGDKRADMDDRAESGTPAAIWQPSA